MVRLKVFPFLLLIGIGIVVADMAAKSDEWKLIEAHEVDLTYRSYFPGSRDPLVTQNGLPDRQLGKGFDLEVDNDLFWGYGYFDAMVHAKTDEDTKNGGGQFRSAGLMFRTGINVTSWLQFGYLHHSEHVIDHEYRPGFPVNDALELKIKLYSSGVKK